MKIRKEQTICEWIGVIPSKPLAGTKLGVALSALDKEPINGLRHREEHGTSGWYIWCGEELSDDPDFFSSLHVEHVYKYLPQIQEYLSLPAGYRFLIDGNNYEDVWFDSTLINQ